MDTSMGASGPEDFLWTTDDLARYMRLKACTIRLWVRVRYDDIPFIKTGRVTRFDPVQIKKWLRKHEGQGHG